jgi:hypothetical protein
MFTVQGWQNIEINITGGEKRKALKQKSYPSKFSVCEFI